MDHSLDLKHTHMQVEEHIMHFQGKKNTKHKDLELTKYGEGNVNMGAGSGETCVQKGGWGHVGQTATCNLNLKGTLRVKMRETRRRGEDVEME